MEKDIKLDQPEINTTKTGHLVVTNMDMKREVYLNQARLKRSSIKVDDLLKIGPFVLQIDQSRLTPEEMSLINTEYIEYI